MTSSGAEQNIPAYAPGHQTWLDENNASMILDREALRARASALGASIIDDPHLYVSSIGPLPQDKSNIIVDWPVPNGPLLHDRHQQELSGALDVSLLTIRQGAQRRVANRWAIPGFFGGIAAAAVAERVLENDAVYYGGIGVLALSMVTLVFANNRDKPKPPEDAPERPALRLEEGRGPGPIA